MIILNQIFQKLKVQLKLDQRVVGLLSNTIQTNLDQKKRFSQIVNFFSFFSYELIRGNKQTVLNRPNTTVISKELAEIVFGDKDPVGEKIEIYGSLDIELEITGVALNREDSHIEFDMILPFNTKFATEADFIPIGILKSIYSYVKLNSNTDGFDFTEKLTKNKNLINPDDEDIVRFEVQSMDDLYLGNKNIKFAGVFKSDSKSTIQIILAIGLAMLFIAIINHVNISTSRSTKRAREVGVKKTFGANRSNLIIQFITEAFLLIFMAVILSILIADFAHPAFVALIGVNFPLHIFSSEIVIYSLALIVFTTLLSGGYPAFILTTWSPITALKSKTGENTGLYHTIFRKILVGFQFTISISMIAGTIIIFQQLNFIAEYDLGFEKENIMVLNISRSAKMRDKIVDIKEELLQNPLIEKASISTDVLGTGSTNNSGTISMPSRPNAKVNTTIFMVDDQFIETYGIDLLKGRNFDINRASDSSKFIVNEAFIQSFNLENPIGETMQMENFLKGEIIGVVKNFNFQGLQNSVSPMAFYVAPWNLWNISLKYNQKNTQQVIDYVSDYWKTRDPDVAPSYFFVDDQLGKFYDKDQKLSQAVSIIAILSIIIASFGLYGLISISLEKRKKRLVLGKYLGLMFKISYTL